LHQEREWLGSLFEEYKLAKTKLVEKSRAKRIEKKSGAVAILYITLTFVA